MMLEDLLTELAGGVLRPAYLLGGEESLIRDDGLRAIREAVLAEGPSDFNLDQLDSRTTSAAALLDTVRALPVMASHRLVTLRAPDARKKKADEEEGESAESFDENLLPCMEFLLGNDAVSTVLVVCASRINRRSKWVKSFSGRAALLDCSAPKKSREIAAFVRAEAQRQGVALDKGAPERLAELVGPQLMVLRQEVAKLGLLVEQGEKVTRAQVSNAVTNVAEEMIWDLTDAIGDGRSGDALQTLRRMLDAGAQGPPLLGALASHFRKLLRVSAGERLGGAPFVVKKMGKQAQRYSPARLKTCLAAIHEGDEMLKGRGGIRPELALERLVLGLSA